MHAAPRCIARLWTHGAPAVCACWLDESGNLELKRICSTAHALHWHARVLDNAKFLADRRQRQRAGAPLATSPIGLGGVWRRIHESTHSVDRLVCMAAAVV